MMMKYTIALLVITFCYSTVGKTVGKSAVSASMNCSHCSIILYSEVKRLREIVEELRTKARGLSRLSHSHGSSSPGNSGPGGGGSGGESGQDDDDSADEFDVCKHCVLYDEVKRLRETVKELRTKVRGFSRLSHSHGLNSPGDSGPGGGSGGEYGQGGGGSGGESGTGDSGQGGDDSGGESGTGGSGVR